MSSKNSYKKATMPQDSSLSNAFDNVKQVDVSWKAPLAVEEQSQSQLRLNCCEDYSRVSNDSVKPASDFTPVTLGASLADALFSSLLDVARNEENPHASSSEGGPNAITANTTPSSGDDPDSSGQNSGTGSSISGNGCREDQRAQHHSNLERNYDEALSGPFLRHYQKRDRQPLGDSNILPPNSRGESKTESGLLPLLAATALEYASIDNDRKQRAMDSDTGVPLHAHAAATAKKNAGSKRRLSPSNGYSDDSCWSSADSGSGSEGGYAGSASYNIRQSSCSSPSLSSSDGGEEIATGLVSNHHQRAFTTPHQYAATGERISKKIKRSHTGSQCSSSIADYSSAVSDPRTADSNFDISLSSGSYSAVSSNLSASSGSDSSPNDHKGSRNMATRVSSALTSSSGNRKSIAPATQSSKQYRHQEARRIFVPSKRVNYGSHHNNSDTLRLFNMKMKRERERAEQEQRMKKYYSTRGYTTHSAGPQHKWAPSPTVANAVISKIGFLNGKSPIFSLGCDTMAHCCTYLEPPEVHSLLTSPLSKDWHQTFTVPQDLWRVLCLSEPFNTKFGSEEYNSSDDSLCSFPVSSDTNIKHLFGKYRLLYTSFVRCIKYLARIKDDAVHGRPPSVIDYGGAGVSQPASSGDSSLHNSLSNVQGVIKSSREQDSLPPAGVESASVPTRHSERAESIDRMEAVPVGVSDKGTISFHDRRKRPPSRKPIEKPTNKIKYGHSQLSERLLGPSKDGYPGRDVDLPWSCAIYSIVNWMVAFTDVEGIQTMCLRVLPYLLEDETQRTTAQRAGLPSIVLRGMVMFPNSVQLHTAAFHTIVLLARPLGGREGMLFHSSMVNSAGIFNHGQQGGKNGKNGIAVMLDSMRRFATAEPLQAMSCWSLVNIALAPSQKAVLVKLGGISATANAMMQHPYSAEVQFRALFALINLVIPSVNLSEEASQTRSMQEQLGEVNDATEREMLDENVGQIANLVVLSMKNFCSSKTILNRACLVLHNLSLTEEYHENLLWTPNCYQMLEWCLANYPSDQVLQQSAAGTLHRLQTTLASDDRLRLRFTSSIQTQQQLTLEETNKGTTLLYDQQN